MIEQLELEFAKARQDFAVEFKRGPGYMNTRERANELARLRRRMKVAGDRLKKARDLAALQARRA